MVFHDYLYDLETNIIFLIYINLLVNYFRELILVILGKDSLNLLYNIKVKKVAFCEKIQ
jgi:hypothetical protein